LFLCDFLAILIPATKPNYLFSTLGLTNGLYALQFVEGQLIGGRDAYADDYEDSPYCGGYSAMGM
jgi:hypothetical protein